MIKYTCVKVKNKEQFEDTPKFKPVVDTPKLNVVVDTSDKTINSLFPSKCPPSYHKIGDICCPVFLEQGKCPAPNSIDKTRYNGMPICAVDNNSQKTLHLCSNLPKTVPSIKRKQVSKICDSNKELINNKCYTKCPKGFVSKGNKCAAKDIIRDEFEASCPKNSDMNNNICLEKCQFGFTSFNNYCVPNNLADY